MSDLRKSLIRLAKANPEIRVYVVPVLRANYRVGSSKGKGEPPKKSPQAVYKTISKDIRGTLEDLVDEHGYGEGVIRRIEKLTQKAIADVISIDNERARLGRLFNWFHGDQLLKRKHENLIDVFSKAVNDAIKK